MTQALERVPQFDLADRMRKALREADIDVQEMAAYLECSRSSVSGWINGRIRPSPQTIRLWAMRCGVPFEWLRDGATSQSLEVPAGATAPYPRGRRELTHSYVAAVQARQHAVQSAGMAA